MLFLEYSCVRSSCVPENLPIQDLIFSKCILESYETCGSMERNSEISASSSEVPLILPHFVVISQLKYKSCHPVFT